MIKLTSFRLLHSLSFLLLIGVIVSCNKKDTAPNDGKTALYSFGPTGAKHGDTLRFVGVNLDKVSAIKFTGVNALVDKSNFKTQTSGLIKLIVPTTAEKGYVTVRLSAGDSIVTKTQLNLNVLSTIASITSQARPGENITITGAYLNWIDRITFAKDKLVTNFVSKTQNQIVVKIPDDAQTGPLMLHYGGTDSADFETADTLKVTLPLITAMAPNAVKPGTNLTITGTNLDLAKKMIFTGVSTPVTTFVSQSATQIVVAVPATAKKGKLTLEALSGIQTTSANDLDIVLPVSTSIAPNPINLGANLTITGTDLDLAKKVIFSGVASAVTTFVSQSVTQIVVRVPAGARDGKVMLEAASGVQTTTASSLDVILPSITSLSPSPVDPGAVLTINGTGLDAVSSVAFQNAAAVTSFVSQSASQIKVTVPDGVLRGKITLGVSNPADTIQSNDILEINGAAPPPTIAFPIYNDALTSNWNGWNGGGWGGTKDLANTSPVREGSKSVKIIYDAGGYGSPFQPGGANINWSAYSTFKISIYGAPGSDGKDIQIKINGQNGPAYGIRVVEGRWTDYSIPLSSFTGVTVLNEIWVQALTNGGGFSIYVDAMGLN
jgi:hypothetical protein